MGFSELILRVVIWAEATLEGEGHERCLGTVDSVSLERNIISFTHQVLLCRWIIERVVADLTDAMALLISF